LLCFGFACFVCALCSCASALRCCGIKEVATYLYWLECVRYEKIIPIPCHVLAF
jgi:hypothetical protein